MTRGPVMVRVRPVTVTSTGSVKRSADEPTVKVTSPGSTIRVGPGR